MAIFTPTQAVKTAGINRSTLYRYLQEGKLSTTQLPKGGRDIDTAELERVFGPLRQANTTQNSPPEHGERTEAQPKPSRGWSETQASLYKRLQTSLHISCASLHTGIHLYFRC